RFLSRYETPETAAGKSVRLKEVTLVDLTDIFGEGNEPKKEMIDKLMDSVGFFKKTADLVANTKIVGQLLKNNDEEKNGMTTNNYWYAPTGPDSYDGTGQSKINAETITVVQLHS